MADVRIINDGFESVAVSKLREHPANPRQGDVGAVSASIEASGFFGALVVQRSTGYVLAGNHRLKAARALGMDALPVTYVDVPDERAMRILLADNRTSDLGTYDNDALAELLGHLASTDAGLTGTGYDADALAALLVDSATPDWQEAKADRLDRLRSAQYVRPVVAVEDVQAVERALAATGLTNRGDAFVAICNHYLDATGRA